MENPQDKIILINLDELARLCYPHSMESPIVAAIVKLAQLEPSGDFTKQLFQYIELLIMENKTLRGRLKLMYQRHGAPFEP